MLKPKLRTIEIPPHSTKLNTSRKGLKIMLGWISCSDSYEGFALDPTNHADEKIEDDVFDFWLVDITKWRQKKGYGTLLVRKTLEEATARGFSTARIEVANPVSLKIMHRMRNEGVIQDEKYVHTPHIPGINTYRSTADIINDESAKNSSTEALDLFENIKLDDKGMVEDYRQGIVEGVIQL